MVNEVDAAASRERTVEPYTCRVTRAHADFECQSVAPAEAFTIVYSEVEAYICLGPEGVQLGQGEFVVLSDDRAQRAVMRSGNAIVLVIPAACAAEHFAVLRRSAATVFSAMAGTTAGIVAHVFRGLGEASDAGRIIVGPRVAQQVAGLIALSCTDQLAHRIEKDSLLMRAQAFIEENLGDLELTQTMIARNVNVSTRTLHRSFSGAGLSLGGWIRARRLEQCRADLENPALDHVTVSAVGCRWGIPDAAHFSRLFKMAYGLSPRQHRERQRMALSA
jgi:AraC-like DNA-binding protein